MSLLRHSSSEFRRMTDHFGNPFETNFHNPLILTSSSNSTKPTTKSLDSESLLEEHTKKIKNIAQVLNLPSQVVGILLRHFNWNSDRVLEGMLVDREKTLEKANINLDEMLEESKIYEPEGEMCQTCFKKLEKQDNIALKCKHPFCRNCWKNYIMFRIKEQNLNEIFCQYNKCKRRVTEEFVKQVVDKDSFKKYQNILAKSFVNTNPENVWCPKADCGKVCNESMITLGTNAKCSCGHYFCFDCKQEAHSPTSCEQYKEWKKKIEGDSETQNWLTANTRECPKCSKHIEKNGGCNHMTCKKETQGCGYEFCWVCLGPWSIHGTEYYKCNHYDPKKHDNQNVEKSKRALERYLHYSTRYENHNQSLKFEKKLIVKTQKALQTISETEDISWLDLTFLESAVNQLCECRHVLKWTYVFAFYLRDYSKAKEFFEFVQERLEHTTEQLSHVLEGDIRKIDPSEALNFTSIAHRQLYNLFDTVHTGLPEGMTKGHENDIIEEKKVLKNADEN
eukprot:Anaeramoba_flamelloidesa808762_74.p1 GENE.a808762_74~~a808762_74.p1  ORF type:complete len:507 (-),score=110.01 a808762_74:95-1615(-)